MLFITIDISLKLCYAMGIHPATGYRFKDCLLFFTHLFNIVFMTGLLCLQFVYTSKPITIMSVADCISCLLLMFHGTVKATSLLSNKTEIMELLNKMEHDFQELNPELHAATYQECSGVLILLKKSYAVVISLYVVTYTSFALFPMFSKGEVLIYECYRPSWFPYYPLIFYEQYIGLVCTLFSTIPVDTMFLSLTVLTQIQFKILNSELKHMFDEPIETESDVQKFTEKLKSYVERHNFLTDYVKRLNNTFSVTLLTFLGIILLAMCVEMYRASTQSDLLIVLRAFLYTSIGILGFMVYYCIPSQALVDEANRISESIYLSQWPKSLKVAKPLMMVMAHSQITKNITACGVVSIDLKTGLNTIKSMISYCMFLKTVTGTAD